MVLPRFYPIVDTAAAARYGCGTAALAEALLEAGARILQFRHKGLFTAQVLEEAGVVAALCREAGALYVVDDRADIAAMLGGGVHVGQDDLSPADARVVVGRAVIGFSTHNREQLTAGDGEDVDYLALGPIFATGSKEKADPVVGIEGLSELRRLTRRPLAVIGGITRENAGAVLRAGADAVAVIADLFPERPDAAGLRQRAREWVRVTEAV